jgi:hypothetical protein
VIKKFKQLIKFIHEKERKKEKNIMKSIYQEYVSQIEGFQLIEFLNILKIVQTN